MMIIRRTRTLLVLSVALALVGCEVDPPRPSEPPPTQTKPPPPKDKDVSSQEQGITGLPVGSLAGLVAIRASGSNAIIAGFLVSNHMVLTSKSALAGRTASMLQLTYGQGSSSPVTRGATDIIAHPTADAAMVYVAGGFSVRGNAATYLAPIDDRPTSALLGRTLGCYGYDSAQTLRMASLRVNSTTASTFNGTPLIGSSLLDADRGAPCVDLNYSYVHSSVTVSAQTQLALSPLREWIADMAHLGRVRARAGSVLSLYVQTASGQRMCADVAWGSVASHAGINQYPCHGGLAQRFYLDETAGTGYPALVNARSGKCIDLCPGCTNLQQYTCHGGANQAWDMTLFATGSGIKLTSRSTNGCMSARPGAEATTPSLPLTVSACVLAGTTNTQQRWFIQWL